MLRRSTASLTTATRAPRGRRAEQWKEAKPQGAARRSAEHRAGPRTSSIVARARSEAGGLAERGTTAGQAAGGGPGREAAEPSAGVLETPSRGGEAHG